MKNVFLLGLLVLVGCNSGPKTTPVSGVIKLDGKPLPNAIVTFVPVGGGTALPAAGTTDSTGKYEAVTPGTQNKPGVAPGKYMVCVVANSGPSEEDTSSQTGSEDTYESHAQDTGGVKSLVAQKFVNPNTSGLTADVSGSEPMTLDFEVTAK
jgi:hypothetical protein